MFNLIVNDVLVEVVVKYKNATISYYDVNIVGYGSIEVIGSREFSVMLGIIEAEIVTAMSNIDSGWL